MDILLLHVCSDPTGRMRSTCAPQSLRSPYTTPHTIHSLCGKVSSSVEHLIFFLCSYNRCEFVVKFPPSQQLCRGRGTVYIVSEVLYVHCSSWPDSSSSEVVVTSSTKVSGRSHVNSSSIYSMAGSILVHLCLI